MKAQNVILKLCALIVLGSALQSCYDKEEFPKSNSIVTSLLCTPEGSEQTVTVNVGGNVTVNPSQNSGLEWASIADASIVDQQLVLRIHTECNETGEDRTGEIYIPLSCGKRVCVTLRQPCVDGAGSEQDDLNFIENWYKMEDFYLGNRSENNVGMPWSKDRTTTQVPPKIAFQYKPEHGWEVVFIDNGRKIKPDRCYFGLYNRYLGKMRVFCYTNNTDITSGYMVRYNLLNDRQSIKYAYHSLPVAIPMDVTLNTNMRINSNDPVTFQNFVEPYGQSCTPLLEGWKAFDIDLSAYSKENNFFTDDVALDMAFYGYMYGMISSDGKIEDTTVGTFEMPQAASVSYNGGMVQSVADACGTLGDLSNSLMKLFTPGKAAGVEAFKWGGGMFSIAEAVLNTFGTGEETYSPAQPGTIELKTEGKIKMTSEYSQNVATNQPGVTLREKAFVHQQPYDNGNMGRKPYIGEGVWSLVTTPTYYIVDDVMLGKNETVRFEPDDNNPGKYFNTSWKSEGVRYVSFFDPTTVQVNLNTNIIKNIAKVEVCATPVVMLGQTFGYTNTYYDFIYNIHNFNRSMPICTRSFTYHFDTVENSPNSMIKYYMKIPASATDVLDGHNPTDIKTVFEPNHPYGLRGFETEINQIHNKKLMVDPEILYNVDGKVADEGKIPDILISVVMRVTTTDGKVFVYSHRFLPKIEHITKSQLPELANKLQAYSDQCAGNNSINCLGNDGSVAVYHPMGKECVARSLKVINAVNNYSYSK